MHPHLEWARPTLAKCKCWQTTMAARVAGGTVGRRGCRTRDGAVVITTAMGIFSRRAAGRSAWSKPCWVPSPQLRIIRTELCDFSSSSYTTPHPPLPPPPPHQRPSHLRTPAWSTCPPPMSAACFIAHRSDCTARRLHASASLREVCPLPTLPMPAEARCEAEVSRCAAVRRISPVFHLEQGLISQRSPVDPARDETR